MTTEDKTQEATEEQKEIYNLLVQNQQKEIIIDELIKYSNQFGVNKALSQGIRLILEKLTKLEEKIEEINKILSKDNGPVK